MEETTNEKDSLSDTRSCSAAVSLRLRREEGRKSRPEADRRL
jgi:hypothetical protein